jgi:hypothetical protein
LVTSRRGEGECPQTADGWTPAPVPVVPGTSGWRRGRRPGGAAGAGSVGEWRQRSRRGERTEGDTAAITSPVTQNPAANGAAVTRACLTWRWAVDRAGRRRGAAENVISGCPRYSSTGRGLRPERWLAPVRRNIPRYDRDRKRMSPGASPLFPQVTRRIGEYRQDATPMVQRGPRPGPAERGTSARGLAVRVASHGDPGAVAVHTGVELVAADVPHRNGDKLRRVEVDETVTAVPGPVPRMSAKVVSVIVVYPALRAQSPAASSSRVPNPALVASARTDSCSRWAAPSTSSAGRNRPADPRSPHRPWPRRVPPRSPGAGTGRGPTVENRVGGGPPPRVTAGSQWVWPIRTSSIRPACRSCRAGCATRFTGPSS